MTSSSSSFSSYKSPYEVLGLRPGASRRDVKEAYRRLCLQYHPDLCPKDARPHSETAFKEISAAYTALTKGAGGHTGNTQTGPGGAYYRYSSAYHTHARRGGVGKFSNGVLAAVLAAPLAMLGFMLQRKKDEVMSIGGEMKIRPYGFFHPPVNPYLRDDLKPRTAENKWFGGTSKRDNAAESRT